MRTNPSGKLIWIVRNSGASIWLGNVQLLSVWVYICRFKNIVDSIKGHHIFIMWILIPTETVYLNSFVSSPPYVFVSISSRFSLPRFTGACHSIKPHTCASESSWWYRQWQKAIYCLFSIKASLDDVKARVNLLVDRVWNKIRVRDRNTFAKWWPK